MIRETIRQSKCRDDQNNNNNNISTTNHDKPCEFAFLAGPESTVKSPTEIQECLKPYIVKNVGWEPVVSNTTKDGYVKKLGLAATRANSSMVLHLSNVRRDIRVLNIQHLKSYGKKWANSRARFTIRIEHADSQITSEQFVVSGYHNDTTSICYQFFHDLSGSGAQAGSNVTLSIDLVDGTTFKIIGLMLCSY